MIDDHSSDMLDMTCGVPQGSVLGPILFIIYINDICNVSDVVKCVLFADDINIFCSEKKLTDLQLTLNRELGKLFVWFSVNKLSLNLSKTNYILFRNRSADTDLNICITTINVTRVQSSKFLGIIIDENLNWKPHIQLVKSKLSKTLSIMYNASKLINYEGMFTLYCSLVLPYLTYCCEIWGNTYTTNVNCLYVIQKKLVRIIHHEGSLAHTNCLFQQMHSLKFHELESDVYIRLWRKVMECIASRRLEACIHLKLKLKHTYYHTTMTKIINKSVIMLYDITLLMFIGIIRNIFVLYYYTTAFKN